MATEQEPTVVQLWRVTLDRVGALAVVLHLLTQTILQFWKPHQ